NTENRAKNALDSRCIRPFSENSAVCLANYGVAPLRGKLIGASLAVKSRFAVPRQQGFVIFNRCRRWQTFVIDP
ncbi:hypothetical protein, partial [Pseudomonas viridiflava]|uniref:hypothetical protein n=1 Tax=Pseudomonas viridiflava TaxID=33069 RepID=UPI001C615288